ncbi:MAG: hypothetical protein H0W68_01295 [Gemmatimonadaceae bacterium]|nr:hypothetical protein [Gemmatimonadaceae bacterium]
MANRKFSDGAGVRWEAWEVYPTLSERRLVRDRRVVARAARDRRQREEAWRPRIAADYARGWIAFQSGVERRRLAPSEDLQGLTDEELRALLARAGPVGRARRPVD